ncbi:hypothetical protein [Paraburkholderia rhynchosiae]|uniref:DUF4148 domain-containing protein n=1 Tax=Paraburkholderia rhynchosiae TaxID=487049 RepID=A0A2N7WXM4_9BURK|nr:hypothetical protein [Paraburkholderia rhynchosiae]PMS34258.1 hypothetical protein C0Z16_01485 [Paraburkholderia rhynchosiae]CAB3638223.1 hypothetical protein LMG27174_00295 [Paraburkholderia rhynchosiae]
MTTPLRRTATCMLLTAATYALPALAQNAAPARAPAMTATAPTGYGAPVQAPVDRRAVQRKHEQALLGAPSEYSLDNPQNGNIDDARRAALLNEQRMTITGAAQGGQQAAPGQRKAPAAANGQVRVADKAARPRTTDTLLPEGAAKAAYADPYAKGKRSVYRSPW